MALTIVSWNMQGGSFKTDVGKATHLESFMRAGYDCICVQEATEPLPSFDMLREESPTGSIKIFSTRSPHLPSSPYFCCFTSWGEGNSRCSMAIYAKKILRYELVSHSNEARPMLLVSLGDCLVGNVHLTSGNPKKAVEEFKRYKSHIMGCSRTLPSFIVGDFNMDWRYISDNIPEELPKFHHADAPTHQNGSTLDYVYCGNSNMDIQMHVSNVRHSDHFSILAVIEKKEDV